MICSYSTPRDCVSILDMKIGATGRVVRDGYSLTRSYWVNCIVQRKTKDMFILTGGPRGLSNNWADAAPTKENRGTLVVLI